MRDTTTGIHIHVKEAMTKFVLETLTPQHKGVNYFLSAAWVPSIEYIIKKSIKSPQTITEVTEAVFDDPELITPTDTLVNLEQRRRTDEKAKIDKCS